MRRGVNFKHVNVTVIIYKTYCKKKKKKGVNFLELYGAGSVIHAEGADEFVTRVESSFL